MMFATIASEIREWSTWALALAAVAIAVWVSGWSVRGGLEKKLKEAVDRIDDELEQAKAQMEKEIEQVSERMQRSLEHRAAADLARWEKLETRYEKLFEALFDRRRKP